MDKSCTINILQQVTFTTRPPRKEATIKNAIFWVVAATGLAKLPNITAGLCETLFPNTFYMAHCQSFG